METRGEKRAGRSKPQDLYTEFSDFFQLALFKKRHILDCMMDQKEFLLKPASLHAIERVGELYLLNRYTRASGTS